MHVGGRARQGVESARIPLVRRALMAIATSAALVVTVLTAAAVTTDVAAAGTTFVVNSLRDEADVSSSDGVCTIASNPSACTLRAAIGQANATAGHDTIEFDIPGPGPHRFTPATRYPIIVDPSGVTIDGYSQPGSATNTATIGSNAIIKIELEGRGPSSIDGLYFTSAGNVIRGIAIFNFRRTIYIRTSAATNNEIVGNFIGTDAAGTYRQYNRVINSNGVHIENGSSKNTIGRPGLADRNVISGNGDRGVALFDSDTDDNVIQNNVIGLSPTGDRLRNWGHGVDINYNASDNVIGGSGAGEANVLSGNQLSGVEISHNQGSGSTTGNKVIANLIGTSLDGTGGHDDYRNREFGVNLEGKSTCPTAGSCGPDISNNLVENNRIIGSAAGVMIWKGAHDNIVRSNTIGLVVGGAIAPSSSHTIWGVLIETGAFDNLIDSNVIAGVLDGIQVRPGNDYTNEPTDPDVDTYGNTFRRNSIWGIVNGFGIDISPISQVNDTPWELDVGIQGGIQGPAIFTASEDVVTVATCAGCLVELFTTDSGLAYPYGQGRVFVRDAVASGSGTVTFTLRTSSNDQLVLNVGDRLAATATDGAGNTSEFSLRVTVAAGSFDRPPTTTPPTTTPTATTPTTTTPTTTTMTPPTTTPGSTPPPAADPSARAGTAIAVRCGSHC